MGLVVSLGMTIAPPAPRPTAPASPPPPLCEHPVDALVFRSFRADCSVCGSYWDLESCAQIVPYDAQYPEVRGHFDPRVGRLKVKTLARWLDRARVDVRGKRVCEVGFGGGTCLPLLASRAKRVLGLEANQAAIDRVRESGLSADLYHVDRLPERFDEPVDLWIFQDSFEHIPEPSAFLEWMSATSASNAEILLVAPRADSLSRRVMGRWWPHKLPDHQFQWSRAGLVAFMERRGFALRSEFFPLKFASPQMVVAHFLHKAGAPPAVRGWLGGAALAIPINFGELGLVFQRGGAARG